MKDLGYQRTPTDAMYRVEMSDGSQWDVPVQIIADSRDEHYSEDMEDTIGAIKKGQLDDSEISDWAGNNMNWSNVSGFAVIARPIIKVVDFEDGWANGGGHVVGDL